MKTADVCVQRFTHKTRVYVHSIAREKERKREERDGWNKFNYSSEALS